MRTSIGFSRVALVLFLLFPLRAEALNRTYVEDFSTTRYKNPTTTARWDTTAGEIKLPPFAPFIAGSLGGIGAPVDVTLAGSVAYVAAGSGGLYVLDITDREHPSVLAHATGYNVLSVAVSGDRLYAGVVTPGFVVYDITDPAAPVKIGQYSLLWVRTVAVRGDYAYLAAGGLGFHIVSIADPTNPTFVGSFTPIGQVRDIVLHGDYAFVADRSGGLIVFDIRNPAAPSIAGSCDPPGDPWGVTISGDRAFLSCEASGIAVVDIGDPAHPVVTGGFDTPGSAKEIAIDGDQLYVADDLTVEVLDITDPDAPALLHSVDTPGAAANVTLAGSYAFVAAGSGGGMQVVRVRFPTPPGFVASGPDYWIVRDIAAVGDYLYAASGGLAVYDVTEPAGPIRIATCDVPGGVGSFVIQGDYAYVAGDSGFSTIDIADPAAPAFLATWHWSTGVECLAIHGDYAFCASDPGYYNAVLSVLDIGDPESPTRVASLDLPDHCWESHQYYLFYPGDLDLHGDFAFLAGTCSLLTIDIRVPLEPAIVGKTGHPEGLVYDYAEVAGDLSFGSTHSFGSLPEGSWLWAKDISDPLHPFHVGGVGVEDVVGEVALSGDLLFAPAGRQGLLVYDITDPSDAEYLGGYDTPREARCVALAGDHAFVGQFGTLGSDTRFKVVKVFQRDWGEERNVARSTPVDGGEENIAAVRLVASQTEAIAWELSADGGANWRAVAPDDSWHALQAPGSDLVWRSSHSVGDCFVNPTCTSLRIEWLFDIAVVDSIRDVPNDQGGAVRIAWTRSGLDMAGSPVPIGTYAIYRKSEIEAPEAAASESGATASDLRDSSATWERVLEVPALREERYSAVVPSLGDSTSGEIGYTSFFVRAVSDTESGLVPFDSHPDSGYSIDNLAPNVPTGFRVTRTGEGGNVLAWDRCPDVDFVSFRVYRGVAPDFVPNPALVAIETADTTWTDVSGERLSSAYKLTAVDRAGNESAVASPETASDDGAIPAAFALHPNIPNPFNATTTIAISLPAAADLRLTIHDGNGRLVRTLEAGHRIAGRHSVVWDGTDYSGRDVASGVFFARFTAGEFSATRKVVLLR